MTFKSEKFIISKLILYMIFAHTLILCKNKINKIFFICLYKIIKNIVFLIFFILKKGCINFFKHKL